MYSKHILSLPYLLSYLPAGPPLCVMHFLLQMYSSRGRLARLWSVTRPWLELSKEGSGGALPSGFLHSIPSRILVTDFLSFISFLCKA